MKMPNEQYTIVSSTYRGEIPDRLIKYFQTISEQTLPPKEIILCIDGQIGNDLEEVLSAWQPKLPLKIIRSEKLGLAASLSIALEQVTTEYTGRCDTDDYFDKSRFEEQIKHIRLHEADITSCQAIEFDALGNKKLKTLPMERITKSKLAGYFANPVNHHSALFRTNAIRSINYSDGRMEDFRLWISALNAGLSIQNSDHILVFASAAGISARRSGADYRAAEWKLFKLNLLRNPPVSIIASFAALSLRWPLRYRALRRLLDVARGFTRRTQNK